MKLNPHFIKHSIDGQVLLVPTAGAAFHGLVQGNESMGFVLECLQQNVTEEEIVSAMLKRYKGDEEVIRADISDAVSRLKEIGAIDD